MTEDRVDGRIVNQGLGISSVRFVHHLVTWGILAFMSHHVDGTLLVDHPTRRGLIASVFSGNLSVTRHETQETRFGAWDLQGVAA